MLKQISKIIILLALFFTWIILFTSKFDNPLGIRSFVVITGSMQPDIPVGSLIFTKNTSDYVSGDIIAYKQGNITVTHRIIGLTDNNGKLEYITRGDANNAPDNSTVKTDEIYGKATLSIPYIGNIVGLMKTPAGFVISIIIPAIIFIAFEAMTIKRELEKIYQKKYQTA